MIALRWNTKQGICGGGLRTTALLAGASLLVLAVPVAQAQSTGAQSIAEPRVESPGQYLVTFGLDQTALTEQNRRVIEQAAEDYRRGGTAQVTVTGYTDT